MERKVYRSKHFMNLSICVSVNGQYQMVDFTGGITAPRRVNGGFSTPCPTLQKAIESHGDFNKSFTLERAIRMGPEPIPVPEVKKPVVEETLKEPSFISKAKNAQEARQELNKKFHISYSRLKNAAMVLDMAKELNIAYPEWIRE